MRCAYTHTNAQSQISFAFFLFIYWILQKFFTSICLSLGCQRNYVLFVWQFLTSLTFGVCLYPSIVIWIKSLYGKLHTFIRLHLNDGYVHMHIRNYCSFAPSNSINYYPSTSLNKEQHTLNGVATFFYIQLARVQKNAFQIIVHQSGHTMHIPNAYLCVWEMKMPYWMSFVFDSIGFCEKIFHELLSIFARVGIVLSMCFTEILCNTDELLSNNN